MPSTSGSTRTARLGARTVLGLIFLFVTAPLWLLLLIVVAVLYLATVGALYMVVWTWWLGRAPSRVLFVYSDSPAWKAHIEQHILPRLPDDAVVLNWSQRATWPRVSLPVLLFRTFAGDRDFNPIALVFSRFARVKHVRFRQAFKDAKHGRHDLLRSLESELFDRIRTDSTRSRL